MARYGDNKIKKAEVRKILKTGICSINYIAKSLECSWKTVDTLIKKHPDLIELHKKNSSKVTEVAKDWVYDAINEGDMKTIRWWLSSIDPEYREKINIDGNLDIKITIKGIDEDKLNEL